MCEPATFFSESIIQEPRCLKLFTRLTGTPDLTGAPDLTGMVALQAVEMNSVFAELHFNPIQAAASSRALIRASVSLTEFDGIAMASF